jgi:hypothetical protein
MSPRRQWLLLLREHASPTPGETDTAAVAVALGVTEGEVRRGLRDIRELGMWDEQRVFARRVA